MLREREIEELVRRAIDLHFHVGPDILPRKYTVEELIESAVKFGIIPDFRFYLEVGRSYQNVGDLDKAVEAFVKVGKKHSVIK